MEVFQALTDLHSNLLDFFFPMERKCSLFQTSHECLMQHNQCCTTARATNEGFLNWSIYMLQPCADLVVVQPTYKTE